MPARISRTGLRIWPDSPHSRRLRRKVRSRESSICRVSVILPWNLSMISRRQPGYNLPRSTFAKEVLMLSSTNLWMGFGGLVYLAAGVFILRKEISAARGWDKLITLGCVFIAVPLAVFAPEHFRGGPSYIQDMAP